MLIYACFLQARINNEYGERSKTRLPIYASRFVLNYRTRLPALTYHVNLKKKLGIYHIPRLFIRGQLAMFVLSPEGYRLHISWA